MAQGNNNNGLYPLDTPITKMGLDDQEIMMLTTDAKKLDKSNLVALRNVTRQYRAQGEEKVLTVFDQITGYDLKIGDLDSIAHAFDHLADRRNTGGQALSGDACCCCTCCPCCTCTASVVIDATSHS